MIVSIVSGRLRVRSKSLKSKRFASVAVARISELPGVQEVRANSSAACVTVLFDAYQVDLEGFEKDVERMCTPEPAPKKNKTLSRQLNRVNKVGMMSTLALSMAYGAAGKKKPHINFGLAFLAFAGAHMVRYSRQLLK